MINLKEYTALLIKSIGLFSWPVGSIYTSTKPTDPHELFGGTWEPIQDTFLLCAGPKHAAGETGGEETHTLTVAESPAHTHTRGTMEITGGFSAKVNNSYQRWGAFSATDAGERTSGDYGGSSYPSGVAFVASRTWTGETSSTGGGSHLVLCRRTKPSTLGSARLNACAGGAC